MLALRAARQALEAATARREAARQALEAADNDVLIAQQMVNDLVQLHRCVSERSQM